MDSYRRNGRKWVKVNFVHNVMRSVSRDDSVQNSRIVNRNKIILEGAKDLVKDCSTFGLLFMEPNRRVNDVICDLVRAI